MTIHPNRIAVKLARAAGGGSLEATPFIGYFHRVIQQASFDGLLLDVADYRHVPNGPSVMLIGHDVDYVIDQTGGEVGLLVVRKRCEGTAGETLRETLGMAFRAAAAISKFAEGRLTLASDRYEVQLLDRRALANDDAGAEALRIAIAPVFGEAFESAFEILPSGNGDRRSPLALRVQVDDAPSLDELGEVFPRPKAWRNAPAAPQAGDAQCEWDLDVEELARMRSAHENFRLLDVREANEFEIANLGGELIPLGTIPEALADFPKDERYVVHCRSGARSAKAVEQMRAAGFEDAWNVRGGILAWSDRIDSTVAKY